MLGHVWKWLKWPAALALLAWLFYQYRDGLDEFFARPKDWRFLALGFAFCLAATALTFFRWFLLVWALEFPFRVSDAFRLGFLGLVFNYAGSGLFGGDMFKAVFIAREQQSRRAVAAATVLLDRVMGLLSLFMLGAIASLFLQDFPQSRVHDIVFWTLWGGSVAGLLGLAILIQPAVTRWRWVRRLGDIPYVGKAFHDVLNGIELYQTRPQVLIVALAMGIISHAWLISGIYSCALGLGGWAPDLGSHYYAMPAAEVIGLIPTPGGIGPQEWAIQKAYVYAAGDRVSAEVAGQSGLFVALAFRLLNVLITALGALYYLPTRRSLSVALPTEAIQAAKVDG